MRELSYHKSTDTKKDSAKALKLSIIDFFSKYDQICKFNEGITNWELHFLCSGNLNYLIKYMTKNLPGVTNEMTCQFGTDLVLS